MDSHEHRGWQGPGSAGWRPREITGVFLVQKPAGSRHKTAHLSDQVQMQEKAQHPILKAVRHRTWLKKSQPFCSIQASNRLDEVPPTVGRAICFTHSVDSDVNLIQKHLHGSIWNNVGPNVWTPCDPVEFTYKINHHRTFEYKMK